MRVTHGIASLTIDVAYEAKLPLCVEWDRATGFVEPHPLSSVYALKVCYVLRRPYFVWTDVMCSTFLFGVTESG